MPNVKTHKIHPSALVHPSVIMEGDIEVGANTIIGSNCFLKGPLSIGEHNQIGAHVMIGVDPEHKLKPPSGKVTIGNGNVIREFTVIQRGIGDLDTEIQDNCFIMAYTYIAHDCLIESDVILCAKVALSGHCRILKGAILGLAAAAHHLTTIGSHAFVGMGGIVIRDVPPFCVVVGNPAQFLKFNAEALTKLSIPPQELQIEKGQLKSKHPYVQECIKRFTPHSRRKVATLD